MEITRSAMLTSTAVGYNITVYVTNVLYGCIVRRYTNVSAASMKRFYRLSGGWTQYTATKEVPFRYLRCIFSEVQR